MALGADRQTDIYLDTNICAKKLEARWPMASACLI